MYFRTMVILLKKCKHIERDCHTARINYEKSCELGDEYDCKEYKNFK